jgi:hypothetical protein
MRWVTTERVQVDRVASAWLIQRFVDTGAEFVFVSRETQADAVADGTPFYLPGAALGKREGRSTFESILAAYQLTDPTLAELGHLLRAVDEVHGPVAFRGVPMREVLPVDAPLETAGVQLVLHGLRLVAADDPSAIAAASQVLDGVYAALEARRKQAPVAGGTV